MDSVPVLYRGPWFADATNVPELTDAGQLWPGRRWWAPEWALEQLRYKGSLAAPGFMDPEGICIFHETSGQLFKATIRDDEKPKGGK